MSNQSRAMYQSILDKQSINYGGYDITRDWKEAKQGSNYVYYNPNDKSQSIFVNPNGGGQSAYQELNNFLAIQNKSGRSLLEGGDFTYRDPSEYAGDLARDYANGGYSQTPINQISESQKIYESTPNTSSSKTKPTITYTKNGQTYTTQGSVPVGGTVTDWGDPARNAREGVGQPITSSNGQSPQNLVNQIQNQGTQTPALTFSGNLKEGTYNNSTVKQIQGMLGITADGDFGPQTKAAVIAFQKANGLVADGIIGPKTLQVLNAKFGGGATKGNTGGTSPDYDTTTGLLTDAGKAKGLPEVNKPTISTSGQARTAKQERKAEIERIKAELEGSIEEPTPYKSLEEFDKLRKEKGVVADEEELASIQNEARMAKEELNQLKQTAGKEVGMGGYTGQISEAERNLNFRMESLSLREQAVVGRLNTKNAYINSALELGKEDYKTALTNYNNEYSKNLKAVELYNNELSDQKKDALTAFETISNLVTESGKALTPQLSQQLDTLALQAGLPTGLFQEAVAGLQAKEKMDNVKIVDNGDTKDLYMWTTDANGLPHLKLIQSVPSVSGSDGNDDDFTKTEQKSYEAFKAEISTYSDSKSALDDLVANRATIIKSIGQSGYDKLKNDINNHFNPNKGTNVNGTFYADTGNSDSAYPSTPNIDTEISNFLFN